jgi:NAD+-dependent secondary alcohol dehydrogenase Adh1
MKAVRLHEYGQLPVIDDVPEPSATSPLDVIVRIGGSGLCRTDLHIVEGQWAGRIGVDLPYVLGHESAGWVEEIGTAVTNVAVGDAVLVHPLVSCGLCPMCRRGADAHCTSSQFPGLSADGGMAAYLKTNARAVVPLPGSLAPRDVAAHADAGLTAYHAVKKAVPLLPPGTTAVVIGAGGLGHIGIQCLTALTAARVIAVDRSEEALELAGKLGADELVPAHGHQVRDVLRHTGGDGAEVVIDFVGEGGTEKDGVAMVRRAGTYFVVGYGGRIEVPAMDLIFSETNIVGNLVGTFTELVELVALARDGKVELRTRTYPLDAVNEAIADLQSGRLRGRGILVP